MKSNFLKNGFTIIELIIAGSVSITVIGLGFTLMQIALKGNKLDETQMGLNGRINDTLDFILDEIKSSKRIIDNEKDIMKFNSYCSYPEGGEFLFGIRLPDQALAKSDYNPEGDQFNLNQIECPIIYSLKPSVNKKNNQYSLMRYGPQFNPLGYYVSPSYIKFQETLLLDGVTSSTDYKKIICPNDWKERNTIRGITFCIDKFSKGIELQIEAAETQKGTFNNQLTSIASIGGFSSIQDENQIKTIPFSERILSSIPSCTGGRCCLIGICLKSNKVTYIIDNSYYMNKEFLHLNGSIIEGNWAAKNNPRFLSPEINGKNLFEYLISNVKSHIRQLPVSDLNSLEQKVFFQIISNNGFSDYLFKDGPKALTNETKIQALTYLDSLLALEQSPIDPWRDICKSLESEYVGQIVMISAWKPKKNNASINEPCVGNQFGKFSEIVRDYNQFYRSKSATGALIIDSISLYNNFCQKNKNAFNNEWLGSISEGAESICIHIK